MSIKNGDFDSREIVNDYQDLNMRMGLIPRGLGRFGMGDAANTPPSYITAIETYALPIAFGMIALIGFLAFRKKSS